VAGLNQAPDG